MIDFKALFNKYRGINEKSISCAQLELLQAIKDEISKEKSNSDVISALNLMAEKIQENTEEIKKILQNSNKTTPRKTTTK